MRRACRRDARGNDARPFHARAQATDLHQQNKLVVKAQTFPLDRAAEAVAISLGGHVRGKLVLLP